MIIFIIYIACNQGGSGLSDAKPAPSLRRELRRYSHSIVAGGLLEMS